MFSRAGSTSPDTSAGAPAGSLVAARDVRYEYDSAGQWRRIIDNGVNQITEYAYDAMGWHSRQTLTAGHFDDLRHSYRLRRTKAHEKLQGWH